jgi:nitroreductase
MSLPSTVTAVDFDEVIRKRRMVRSFRADPVDAGALERILYAARRAPSAGFTQGWGFLVLQGDDETARFWSASFPQGRDDFGYPGLFNAPVIVIPCSNEAAYLDRYAEPDKGWTDRDPNRWPVPYWHIDTGFASMQLQLAAVNEGLGCLFFGIFGERIDAVRAAFGIPPTFMPIGTIAMGHPAGDDAPSPSLQRRHKPVDEVIHFGTWN